jgi:hypothetical protein
VETPNEKGAGYYGELVIEGDAVLDVASLSRAATVKVTAKLEGPHTEELEAISIRSLLKQNSHQLEPDYDNGYFTTVSLPPGRYVVGASSPDVYIKSLTGSGAKVTGAGFEITGSDPVTLSATLAHGVVTLNGIAKLDSKGFAGAAVILKPLIEFEGLDRFRFDQSDSDGTFTLSDVVPGDYILIAIENGWDIGWHDFKALRPYAKSGTRVHVEPGKTMTVETSVQKVAK